MADIGRYLNAVQPKIQMSLTLTRQTHIQIHLALADAHFGESGAGDEIRTRDPHLGKVMLYH